MCLVASVTLGTGEGVYVLIVVVAVFTGHLQITPDRLVEIRGFFGECFLARFFVRVLLHDSLLSVEIALQHLNASRSIENIKLFELYSGMVKITALNSSKIQW